jgi:hypothetical protein
VVNEPVDEDEFVVKKIVVTVVREDVRKPFLGGFRNRKTGVEYHHASSQTPVALKLSVLP